MRRRPGQGAASRSARAAGRGRAPARPPRASARARARPARPRPGPAAPWSNRARAVGRAVRHDAARVVVEMGAACPSGCWSCRCRRRRRGDRRSPRSCGGASAPGVEAASSRVWMRGWAIQRIRVNRVVPRNRVRSAPMFQRSRKTSSSGFASTSQRMKSPRVRGSPGRRVADGELDARVEIPADQHDAAARLQHAEPRRGEIVGGIHHQRSPRRRRAAPRRGIDRRTFGRLHPAASHAHPAYNGDGEGRFRVRARFAMRTVWPSASQVLPARPRGEVRGTATEGESRSQCRGPDHVCRQ